MNNELNKFNTKLDAIEIAKDASAKDQQKIEQAAFAAMDAHIEFKKAEAALNTAKAAYNKAFAKLLRKQGSVAASEGDVEKFLGYVSSSDEYEDKDPYAAQYGVSGAVEHARLCALSPAAKNTLAIRLFTRAGQEKADAEHESLCESRAAASFEDAAYGRGE